MPPIIYECTIGGLDEGQEINNVLYYATLEPTNNGWDATIAADLGFAVASAWVNNALPPLPNNYSFERVTVRGLDYQRNTVSTYGIEVGAEGNGLNADPQEGTGLCAIIAFQCSPASQFENERVPRKSYLAFGPLANDHVGESNALTFPTAARDNLTALLTQGHLLGTRQFSPVRLGVVSPTNGAAIGSVDGVIFRPNVSFRRSRMPKPTGR